MEVKAYFESNTERVERELTKLSFDWVTYFSEPWEPDNDLNLIGVKQVYKEEVIKLLQDKLQEKTNDMLYYCQFYLDIWLM